MSWRERCLAEIDGAADAVARLRVLVADGDLLPRDAFDVLRNLRLRVEQLRQRLDFEPLLEHGNPWWILPAGGTGKAREHPQTRKLGQPLDQFLVNARSAVRLGRFGGQTFDRQDGNRLPRNRTALSPEPDGRFSARLRRSN